VGNRQNSRLIFHEQWIRSNSRLRIIGGPASASASPLAARLTFLIVICQTQIWPLDILTRL